MKFLLRKLLSICLIICMCIVGFNFKPVFSASGGEDRYTVLLLDAAGKKVFHINDSFLWLGGPKEYISDSAIDEVKESAKKFLNDAKYSISNNYIAIVTYSEDATVISDFSNNYSELKSALNGIKSLDDKDAQDGTDNLTAGLKLAEQLLTKVNNENAIKNVLLCTTGMVDKGEYNYDGKYNDGTRGSRWQNEDTQIELYAYANCSITAAEELKNNGVMIYVVGIHRPIEAALPSEGKDVAEFLRITAKDIASSEDMYYAVEKTDELDFVFGELQYDVIGTKTIRIYNDSNAYKSDAPKEYPDKDSGIEFGGYYYDMAWGPALFETPATRMHLQALVNSANYNLAMISGNLCATSYNHNYLKQTYNILGFDDENISLYSYPASDLNRPNALRNGNKFADDNDLAFSIASKEITISGITNDLLIITLKGTQGTWEAIKDGTCVADKNFYGYLAWDWIWEFEEDVFAGLEDYHNEHPKLGERPLKILVTGHSLGGAGANLVAAKLNKEVNSNSWYAKNTDLDDIYAYTFGAIDSITKDRPGNKNRVFKEYVDVPVAKGYENIINIYNYLDTFGPSGGGVYGVTAAGNSMYGKFGLFYTFTDNMKKVINDDSEWPTHEIVGYVYEVSRGGILPDTKTNRVKVWIRCPVDVEVYKKDELICSILSNELCKSSSDIPVSIENEAKTIILPSDDSYKLIITATNSGSMEYSAQKLDNTNPLLIDYKNVSLQTGKRMMSEIYHDADIENIELFVIDKNGKKIVQIATDGTETKIISVIKILLIPVWILMLILATILLIHIIKNKKKEGKSNE